MKKVVTLLVALLAVGGFSATAFAAPVVTNTAYSVQTLAASDDQAVEDYVAAQEARKVYLKGLLDSGLLTQEQYDQSVAAIDANIAYVRENGIPQPPAGYYGGGYGGGYGACCWGW